MLEKETAMTASSRLGAAALAAVLLFGPGGACPEPRRGPKRVEQGRKPSAVRGLNAAPAPAAAPPVATSNGINPSADRGGLVDVLRTVVRAANSLHSTASGGFVAAWLMAGALLLALAVISAVSDPPRLPSEGELARASTRVPHERGVSERF